MDLCYPSDTDWGCAFTDEELATMRSDLKTLKQMQLSEARAWYTLAALTAYRLGVCPELVRPTARCCSPFGTWMAAPVDSGNTGALPLRTIGALNITPYVTGGQWVNGCGCGPSLCGHGDGLREILLPGPVGDIEFVKIGAETISPTRYRVDEGNRLISTDPTLIWPASQDFDASVGQPDTFAISYYRGMAPNDLVRAAAGALAAEFYKLCTADKNCRFPRRVKQVTRGGTTYEVDVSLFDGGLTRVPEADFVIRLLNPHLRSEQSRVTSPDAHLAGGRARRQTWGNW